MSHAVIDHLCEDCPPVGYPLHGTRCGPCPRRVASHPPAKGEPGMSLLDIAKLKINDQLEWRGPNDKTLKYVVIEREYAEAVRDALNR